MLRVIKEVVFRHTLLSNAKQAAQLARLPVALQTIYLKCEIEKNRPIYALGAVVLGGLGTAGAITAIDLDSAALCCVYVGIFMACPVLVRYRSGLAQEGLWALEEERSLQGSHLF